MHICTNFKLKKIQLEQLFSIIHSWLGVSSLLLLQRCWVSWHWKGLLDVEIEKSVNRGCLSNVLYYWEIWAQRCTDAEVALGVHVFSGLCDVFKRKLPFGFVVFNNSSLCWSVKCSYNINDVWSLAAEAFSEHALENYDNFLYVTF